MKKKSNPIVSLSKDELQKQLKRKTSALEKLLLESGRESQVQLALERVRARTMAMQRSEELADVALALFQQVKELGIRAWVAGFNIWQPGNTSYIDWITGPSGEFLEPYTVDLTTHSVFRIIMEARQRGEEFFISELEGQQLVETYELLSSFGDKGQFQKILDSGIQFPKRQINHFVFGAQVSLLFITYEPCPEGWDIFKRFGKVFEQTYTRFLDLEKAELQAREAQIQLALERVRARTMAMQRSNELQDAALLLFQQLRALNVPLIASGFNIWDDDRRAATAWMAIEDTISQPFKLSSAEDIFVAVYEAAQNGESLFVLELRGKELETHLRYLRTIPVFKALTEKIFHEGHPFPQFQIIHCAFFSQGYLTIITYERVPEVHDVFKRFAKVFEQTYTRFLDLQKAEAQAREAQIEAALERVRSRTMAMQRSDELGDAAMVMFQQMKLLGAPQWASGYNIWDEDKKALTAWMAREDVIHEPFKTPSNEDVFLHFYEAYQRGESFYVEELAGEACASHYRYMSSLPVVGEIFKNLPAGVTLPTFQIIHIAFFAHGYLMFITYEPVPQLWDIFKRFAKVFEQTYTRFLDLKLVEAQAKESQIQAALERVRSRSMGMQKSDELKEVIQVVFEQFVHLNMPIEHTGFVMDYKVRDDYNIWVADPHHVPSQLTIPYFDSVYYNRFNEAKERGEDFFVTNLGFEEKNRFYRSLFNHIPGLPEEAKEFYFSCPGIAISTVLLEDVCLYIENFSGIPYSDQDNATLMRFGKVFQQTYTRFLDLQKAEGQARESQIEAALERVRSRSMGMQKSEELRDVVQVIYEQFIHLGFNIDGAGFNVDIRDSDDWNLWMAHRFALVPTKMHVPYFDHPLANSLLQARNNGDQTFVLSLTREEKNKMLDHVSKYVDLSEDEKKGLYSTPGYLISEVLFKDVSLFIENYTGRPYTDAENVVLMRFGKAFEQSYIRFKDLMHAEAQVREAKIEAGLERARTQSMRMQNSDELNDTLQVFHHQVDLLGINSEFSFLWLPDEENDKHVFWATWAEEENGSTMLKSKTLTYPLDRNEHYTAECLTDWKGGEPIHTYKVPPAEVKNYFAAWQELLSGLSDTKKLKPEYFPDGVDYVEAYMKYGCFGIVTRRLLTEDEKEILRRFSVEFERTYTRFLDLQKAEAQAREAQIEAALERVRANVMAMKNSKELNETSLVFGEQLRKLGIDWQFSYFWLIEENKDENTFWITWPDNKSSTTTYSLAEADASFKECITAWKRQDKIHFSFIPPQEVQEWLSTFGRITADAGGIAIKIMRPENFKDGVFYYDAMIKFGSFGILSNRSINDEEKRIQTRFAVEFERAYTRFLDLTRAEAQALEAIKRASVDRVRAEIASMRTTNDLELITPLIWNELTILGVPFIRCGVFIMDEVHEQVHTFLSTPEGKAILSFTSAFSNQKIITEALPYWRRKEIYKAHWDEAAFLEQAKNLVQQGAISSSDNYLTENRPKNLYLYFLPFLQGLLYVGNGEPLNDEHLQLVQALAEAFSTAYARYEDFNKLESANLKIEKTLVDLKLTQAQLVQSEKMASLGELTAGIAHEIQNPLNFVNNFAEVNKELLTELSDEIEKGNYEGVKIIANDLINNEEKISHHGKRADAIVKGMLQHSRSTSVTKEPTDINKLTDEYLRLAYHGLRAKDKLFNATMKCNYDEGIGNINVFPQDIGRVLLNLYNNAFYAVTEKKKQNGEHYQPLVQVTTQKLNGKVEIIVKDNGNGIPQKVRDKIFQPFFTTKPTGQGTGLGLSLSYDIVKAHGGEIKVDTNEGEFTEFAILLPG